MALGILLSEGIGDTIRVSLTDDPEKEVQVGVEILRSLGMRDPGPSVTSCPTCGRTKADVFRVAAEVQAALERIYRKAEKGRPFPHVAVMGCVVNGPGEAKAADIALCGGDGVFLVYDHGRHVETVPESRAVEAVLARVRAYCAY